jgi:hypothetical protein
MMLNAAWHASHPMPARASLDERVAWHLAPGAEAAARAEAATTGAVILR